MIKKQDIKAFAHNFLIISLIIICVFLIFKDQTIVSTSVAKGLSMCVNIIIPSLFPFMIICNFINLSPIVKIVSKLFSPITRFIFRMPEKTGSLIFMSFIGGYPTGSKMISDAISIGNISAELGDVLLCFCVNAGPAFVITSIGYLMLGSKRIGLLLLFSHILGSIIIGIILGARSKNKYLNKDIKNQKWTSLPYSEAFVKSVIDSGYAVLNICCFVIIFWVITNLIKGHLHISSLLYKDIFYTVLSLLEITVGMNDIVKINGFISILISSFLISFSGISVICQVFFFMSGHKFNKNKFIVFRIFHGLISSIITAILINFVGDIQYTLATTIFDPKIELYTISPFMSLVILALSLNFIMFTYNEIIQSNYFIASKNI